MALCYHAVDEEWPADLSLTPDAFARQLDFLLDRGYRAATFTESIVAPPSQRTVAITFDDGFRSVIDCAFPLLAERGFVATVFVPTAFIDAGRPASWDGVSRWLGTEHEHKMLPLTHAELRQLADAGWEIGSHTCTHPHLTRLDDDALSSELVESRRRCGELVGRCTSLAYPYGDFDDRVQRAAAKAGYRTAGTIPSRFHSTDPLAWPRVGIWHSDSDRVFRVKVSPSVRRLRRSAVWDALDKSRRALRRVSA